MPPPSSEILMVRSCENWPKETKSDHWLGEKSEKPKSHLVTLGDDYPHIGKRILVLAVKFNSSPERVLQQLEQLRGREREQSERVRGKGRGV